jgi:hypothetical protein
MFQNAPDFVMPAKAGIQPGSDLSAPLVLDPGLRRGDGSVFSKRLIQRLRRSSC